MRAEKSQHRFRTPLERRLKDYSLAAAGIGVIVFAPSADAAVTVVPVGLPLNPTTVPSYTLKIGGQSLFNLNNNTTSNSGFTVYASVTASSVRAPAKIFAHVGPKRHDTLASSGAVPATLGSTTNPVFVATSTAGPIFSGSLGTKYLLFTFGSGPKPQNGWVEITISHSGKPGQTYQATVVRYAYETQPGVPLAAGATTDSSGGPPPTPAPNSLWLLALGAAGLGGLELLRRRRAA